jgi:transmembrane sensor
MAMPLCSNEPQITELKQQAIDWLVRLRSDDLSDGEMYAFADWLSQDHVHSEAFAAVENLFNDMVNTAKRPVANVDISSELNQIHLDVNSTNKQEQRIHRPSSKRYTRWMASSVALAAAWLFAVILIIPQQAHLLDNLLSDYHTETGELREIQLTDGSRLLLNTNSAVSVKFNESVRQITLYHGQANFTVAKDAQRPFEVVADGLIVRALGTVFEVYKSSSNEISVTVQEHAVAVRIQTEAHASAERNLSKVNVQQGQQLRYHPGDSLPQPKSIELSQADAWQQHQLFINDRPLSELIAELDRYRIGRVFLSDEKLKNLRVTGVFSLDNPDAVLNSVGKVLALEETRLGPWWVLLHR